MQNGACGSASPDEFHRLQVAAPRATPPASCDACARAETGTDTRFAVAPKSPATIDPHFVAMFRAEFRGTSSLLRRLGVAPMDVEDVTQDLFITVHKRWGDYDPARPIRPWLRAFAVRAASDYRRRARVRYEQTDDDTVDPTDQGDSSEATIEARQVRRDVMEALDALSPERREVVVLVLFEETPVTEAAETLQIPVNTAYSRLREGRIDFASAVRRIRLRRGER